MPDPDPPFAASDIDRFRAEVLAWLDEKGPTAPDCQWRSLLDAIRLFRPVYREGYIHHGVTLHEVLD